MDMTWKILENSATVIGNYITYDFYAKFFGYKRKSFNNDITSMLLGIIGSIFFIADANQKNLSAEIL